MRVFLFSLFIVLGVGCASTTPHVPSPGLMGSAWRLVALDGAAVPTGEAGITATFSPEGRLSGTAGCNRYFASFEVSGEALTLSQVGSTRMACEPDVMAREQAFLDALGAVRAWEREGDALELEDAAGETRLRFVRDAAAAATQQALLTGTVSYLPRIALPPNAVVTVRLLDVSRADAPATVVAHQTIPTQGQQVPVPFAFTYDRDRIDPRHRYAVRAEIHDAGGALLWTTDTHVPVLTQGAPTDNIGVRVVQVSEDDPDAGSGATGTVGTLVGPTWRLVRIARASGVALTIDADEAYTLSFGTDGRYAGQADCNRYGGEYEVEADGEIDFERGLTTLAACPAPSAADAFFGVFHEVERYAVAGNRLTLSGDAGVLVFALEGTSSATGGMPPQPTRRDHAYRCDSPTGPFEFRIRTGPGEIALWLPERFEGREGGTYRVLGQVVSASGARYQDGPVTVWTKGLTEALLEVDGETFRVCEAVSR